MKRIFCPLLVLAVFVPAAIAWAEDEPTCAYVEPASDMMWVTEGSNVTQITTGFWYMRDRWYGQASMGGLSAHANRENAFFLGLQLGRRFPIIPRLFVSADLGYRHVITDGSEDPAINVGKYFTLDAKARVELVLGRHITFFLGGGYTKRYQGYSLGSDTHDEGVVFWGVGLL